MSRRVIPNEDDIYLSLRITTPEHKALNASSEAQLSIVDPNDALKGADVVETATWRLIAIHRPKDTGFSLISAPRCVQLYELLTKRPLRRDRQRREPAKHLDRQRSKHEVDEILKECQWLALKAEHALDTS